jgi:ADP-ribose pyrophosphatase
VSDAPSDQPWQVLGSEPALDVPWMRIRRDRVVMQPATPAVDYYVWEGPDIATVVPRTPAGDFVLCRQYRHAMGRSLLQFPAGQVDAGEFPAEAARRELLEETGYAAPTLIPLGTIAAYPTKYTGLHHLFLALDAEQQAEPRSDPSEVIALELITRDQLLQSLGTPDFMVADSVVAAFLAVNRDPHR